MTACSQELSKGRKKRVMPEGLATPDDVGAFSQLSSHPLHKTTKARIFLLFLGYSEEHRPRPAHPLELWTPMAACRSHAAAARGNRSCMLVCSLDSCFVEQI